MKTLLLTLLLIVGSSNAFALTADEVAKLYYRADCDHRCREGVTLDRFLPKDFYKIPGPLYKALVSVASDQAQIWGDTILEGDYTAEGKTQLDQVLIMKQAGRIVGYSITYSERAWYTGKCAYFPQNPSSIQSCEEGRIYETSFVSTDLNDAQVDENRFAEFKPKE